MISGLPKPLTLWAALAALSLTLVGCLESSLTLTSEDSKTVAYPDNTALPILVGVQYFSGWWPETPNNWQDKQTPTVGWTDNGQYPERTPLLGKFNSQETMDKEITAAADHAIGYFNILWFPETTNPTEAVKVPLLNRGLTYFMNSANSGRMKFTIEYTNHAPYGALSDAQWNQYIQIWLQAMKHPSYLKVGNRLVFKIHDSNEFLSACSNNVVQCQLRISLLRQAARDAGLGEMVIGGGAVYGWITPSPPAGWPNVSWAAQLFDFTTHYESNAGKCAQIDNTCSQKTEYPFKDLVDGLVQFRDLGRQNQIPYLPFSMAGYDLRAWKYYGAPFFGWATQQEWKDELLRLRDELNGVQSGVNLGIPLLDGSVRKSLMLYAWNEFGEGGVIAPTISEGYLRLEAINDVFGSK